MQTPKPYTFNQLRDELLQAEGGKEQVNAAQMNEVISKMCQLVQGPNGAAIIKLLQTHKPSK